LDWLIVVPALWPDMGFDKEWSDATSDPMVPGLVAVGDDATLLDNRPEQCTHGSILT
jgi:hypothetical protein